MSRIYESHFTVIQYRRVAALPATVRGFCHSHGAWVVGSGAKYLLDLKKDKPRDWDILVPLSEWPIACRSIPEGSITNAFGGIKLSIGGIELDVWGADIGEYFARVSSTPAFAVQPRSMSFLMGNRMVKYEHGKK